MVEACSESAAIAVRSSPTQLAICARELKPSLLTTLGTWLSTVVSEMKRRAPICSLLRPLADRPRDVRLPRFSRNDRGASPGAGEHRRIRGVGKERTTSRASVSTLLNMGYSQRQGGGQVHIVRRVSDVRLRVRTQLPPEDLVQPPSK